MDIALKIRSVLLNNNPLLQIIGQKIQPIFATQGTEPPAILYEIEEEASQQSPICNVRSSRMSLHCFSRNYGEARNIADLCEKVLDRYHDEVINLCLKESQRDIPEPTEEGQGQIYHTEIIFKIESE